MHTREFQELIFCIPETQSQLRISIIIPKRIFILYCLDQEHFKHLTIDFLIKWYKLFELFSGFTQLQYLHLPSCLVQLLVSFSVLLVVCSCWMTTESCLFLKHKRQLQPTPCSCCLLHKIHQDIMVEERFAVCFLYVSLYGTQIPKSDQHVISPFKKQYIITETGDES